MGHPGILKPWIYQNWPCNFWVLTNLNKSTLFFRKAHVPFWFSAPYLHNCIAAPYFTLRSVTTYAVWYKGHYIYQNILFLIPFPNLDTPKSIFLQISFLFLECFCVAARSEPNNGILKDEMPHTTNFSLNFMNQNDLQMPLTIAKSAKKSRFFKLFYFFPKRANFFPIASFPVFFLNAYSFPSKGEGMRLDYLIFEESFKKFQEWRCIRCWLTPIYIRHWFDIFHELLSIRQNIFY